MTVSINARYSHNYIQGVLVKETLNPANETVARGHYAATTLSAVDAELATVNIKNGITIFGFAGDADVRDISDATAVEAEVLDPETFYAVSGGIRTGSMPTVALAPGSSAYPQGYHAGDGGGLPAIDADLATGNIKSGITIFNVAGHNDVRDISDADLVEAEAPTGKFFYAVSGGRRTGSGTKTLNPANENVPAGYYAATTLSAVDAQLAVANIALGVNIFGFVGTVAPGGVETIDKHANAVIANNATYTPGVSGIFYETGLNRTSKYVVEYFSTADGAWYRPDKAAGSFKSSSAIGDGTNYRIKNLSGGNAEYCLMRHYIDSGTYERARDEDLGAGVAWTPATSGFFSMAGEEDLGNISLEIQLTTAGWNKTGFAENAKPVGLPIGDGTNLRIKNDFGSALFHVTMRAIMT